MREATSSGKVNFLLDRIKLIVRTHFKRENLAYSGKEGTIGTSGDNSEKAINLVSHVVTLGVK